MSRLTRRGYAMPLVLAILLLLMVAFGALLTTLSGVSGSIGRVLAQRKTRLECQGLSRVTAAQMRALAASGDATRENIEDALFDIRVGAWHDRIRGVQIEAEVRDTGAINTVALGPLSGLPYIERVISTRLRLEEDDDACRALTEQPVASFAVTQFSTVGEQLMNTLGSTTVQRCDLPSASFLVEAPSSPSFTPSPLDHAIAWTGGAVITQLAPSALCSNVTYAAGAVAPDAVALQLPFMPGSLSFSHPDDILDNPYALRVSRMSSIATSGQAIAEATQKLPMLQSDLRIINGAWYLSRGDLSTDWPGTRIWSDSFDQSTIDGNGPRLYSLYERSNGDSALGEPAGRMLLANEGVVSYGSPYWGERLARTELCTSTTPPCVLRSHVEPREDPEVMVRRAARIAMTRTAFNSRGIQTSINISTNTDTRTSRQTPINVNMAWLATAFQQRTQRELGSHLCLDDGCGSRQFNGILYVTNAVTDYSFNEYAARTQPPVGNNWSLGAGAKNHVLTPLWAPASFWTSIASLEYGAQNIFRSSNAHSGPVLGITDAVVFRTGPGVAAEGNGGFGYNALRITDAADLTAFNDTGLTIISSMPVFIEGDFNTQTRLGRRPAAMIIAPLVVVSTPGIEAYYPAGEPFDPPLASVPEDPRLVVHASVVTTLEIPMADAAYTSARRVAGTPHYAAVEAITSLNPGAVIELHGAVATIPSSVRASAIAPLYLPRVRVEQHYPLELTTATVRTESDRRLPPGTPRATFVLGSLIVN